ncbi:hypothetical protein PENSPDRAFT_645192 [Peniophora sp. CONT]|nr:hypothetical protein PENSPDRAFT_645192 [Peniophora sp. CONT]
MAPSLAERVANKRFESNEMLPVFQLPNELLGMVAAHLMPIAGSALNPRTYPIIALSHACRRWRDATITPICSSCWSTIPLSNLFWMNICLERSRNSPISVSISSAEMPSSEAIVTRLSPYMGRVDALFVSSRFYPDSIPESLWSLLMLNAPSIESLTFEFNTATEEEHVDLPSNIFAGQAPRPLEYLESLFCNFSPAPHFLRAPNLTMLKLDQCTLWETMDDMCASLRAMPLLEVFYAYRCTLIEDIENDYIPPPAQDFARSIPMIHLNSFVVESWLYSAMTLFEALAIPFTADIKLKNDQHDFIVGDAACTRLAALLKAHLSSLLSAKTIATDLFIGARGDDTTVSWNYAISAELMRDHSNHLPDWVSSYDESTPLSITIEVGIDMPDADTDRLFGILVDAFFSNTTSMYLLALDWRPRLLLPFVQRLPELQSLRLDRASLAFLLPEICSEGSLPTQLPGLRELRLQDLDLTEDVILTLLFASLRMMSAKGLRISIKDCAVTAGTVEKLRLLSDVEWDGVTKKRS